MNGVTARRVILGSVAATGTIAAVQHYTKRDAGLTPPLRIFIGACIAAAVLSMAAEFAPDVAAALAVVIFLGALVAVTPSSFGAVNRTLTGQTAAGAANRAAQAARDAAAGRPPGPSSGAGASGSF